MNQINNRLSDCISESSTDSEEFKNMLHYVIDIVKQNNCIFIDIPDNKSIEVIYQLFQKRNTHSKEKLLHNEGDISKMTAIEIYYHGLLCHYILSSKTEIIKFYYMKAINLDYHHAMHQMGNVYRENKQFNLMRKYYDMAIDHGNYQAILAYISFYSNNGKQRILNTYLKMAKNYCSKKLKSCKKNELGKIHYYYGLYFEQANNYYQMELQLKKAANLDNINAIYKLIMYYRKVEKHLESEVNFSRQAINFGCKHLLYTIGCRYKETNKELALKFFVSYLGNAIENGYYDVEHIYSIGRFMESNQQYDIMKKCYLLVGNSSAYYNLGMYYINNENDSEMGLKYLSYHITKSTTLTSSKKADKAYELGIYFEGRTKYDLMIKFFEMASMYSSNNDFCKITTKMAKCYETFLTNVEQATKYYTQILNHTECTDFHSYHLQTAKDALKRLRPRNGCIIL